MASSDASKTPYLVLAIVLTLCSINAFGVVRAASGGVMGGSSFSSDDNDYPRPHDSSSSYSSSHHYDYHSSQDAATTSSSGDIGVGAGFLFFLVFILLILLAVYVFSGRSPRGNIILMLQVALLGEARTLVNELDQVAYTANTASVKGLHYILTESCLALLRYHNKCISGYSRVEHRSNNMDLEKRFNEISFAERGKFDIETLVNVNNMKVERNYIKKATDLGKEYIVVTILVAAKGGQKLPDIKDIDSLKLAVQSLASIEIRTIKAVQVLWSPQNANDALHEDELDENYPLLSPISFSGTDTL